MPANASHDQPVHAQAQSPDQGHGQGLAPALAPPATPWWRVPQMWLVVGGPLAVIVAGLITAYIAVSHADPVLDKADYERDLAAAKGLQGQARLDALAKMQPAHQARNHAASPVLAPQK